MNLLGLEEILCCIQEETVSLFPEKNFPRTDHFTKFCGFFMKNKDLECEKIGFQVEKLNKACTKKQSDPKQTPFFVSRVTENTSKTMIYISLQRANVTQILLSKFFEINNSKNNEGSKFCNNTKVLGLVNAPERSSFNNSFDSLTTMLEVRQQDVGDANENSDDFLIVCHVLKDHLKSVGTMRILLLANFCQKFLDSNASPVFILSNLNNVQYMEKVKSYMTTLHVEENDFKEIEGISSILEKLCDSKYCLKKDKVIFIDGEKFANENSLRDFPRDIQFIQILLDGNATKVLKVAACINNFTKGKKSKILHILSDNDYHKLLQSSLLFNILNTDSTSTFSALCNKDTKDVVEDWLSLRKKELWKSYKSKFGKKVQGDYWEVIINNVAMASIKLDTFSVAFTNMLDIKKIDSRNSLFIMYNYARICKLKNRYQAMVAQGIYPPIMAIQDIDFSILSLQSEWRLMMYILNYSILLSNIRAKILSNKLQVDAHQIYDFLYNLSRSISSYYHQTKILLEPRDHLFALISARLHLSSALQQVMDDGFRLLDVNPPQEM